MKNLYRTLGLTALIFLLLATACTQQTVGTTSAEATALAMATSTPATSPLGTPVGTAVIVPGETGTAVAPLVGATPAASATPLTGVGPAASGTPLAGQTQSIPVTGGVAAKVLCGFCVGDIAHAVVLLPQTSAFTVVAGTNSAQPATCNSVESVNGQQLVICYGTATITFGLNVCASNGTCAQVPVKLQSCPLSQQTSPQGVLPTATAVISASPTPTSTGVVPTPTGIYPPPPTVTP